MSSTKISNNNLHFRYLIVTIIITSFLHLHTSSAVNRDGVSLLSLKYNILSDPLSVLHSWNYKDETPCKWIGVACENHTGKSRAPDPFPVIGLSLPDSQLSGSVPPELGTIQHLRYLDLSNNYFNGSLPELLFNASDLQVLSLANNRFSGELPAVIVGGVRSLSFLNLSGNFLTGKVPETLAALQSLSVLSLRSNFFSGAVPSGFSWVEVLDLSSNLLNESLPVDFGGGRLSYMNLSRNNLPGTIPAKSVREIPANATLDLSFNNLTGEIPENEALWNQKTGLFAGNAKLCGKPLKILCSFLSPEPNVSVPSPSSPAIAVKPKGSTTPVDVNTNPEIPHNGTEEVRKSNNGMKPGTIAGIIVGDLAGIGILAIVFLSVHQIKKKRNPNSINKDQPSSKKRTKGGKIQNPLVVVHCENSRGFSRACPCLLKKGDETTSDDTCSDVENNEKEGTVVKVEEPKGDERGGSKSSKLVMVDGGEMELDMERLLRAAAYVVGAAGKSIVYRAVLEDGTALAVRRMGCGGGGGGLREFESNVRFMAKLRHPNVVRVRGFYWGSEEKLLISDYVSNGSLAAISHRKHGSSSPYHLPLEVRLKIARGIARGLTYIHDKKHVHANLKPTNIFLTLQMEPIIADFGLDRLLLGSNRPKITGSSRSFDGKLPTPLDGPQDLFMGRSPFTTSTTSSSSSVGSTCPYHAPESLKNVKPSSKWDVYSFGIVLLKLLTGKEFSEQELLSHWTASATVSVSVSASEDEKNRGLALADVAIRAELAAREDAMVACFKLGFGCASMVPQKRPSMKEALQVLEKICWF